MKRSIEDIRRQELIEGAYRAFLQHGIDGLTTARICKEAGMSPGILSYYFKSKDEVLFWMVRHANRVIMDEVAKRMKAAPNRWERLLAIIEGNFPKSLFEQNTANAWLSFYVASARDPQLERLQRLFHRRLASNISSCVSGIVSRADLPGFVETVAVLIDGCWLHRAAIHSQTTSAGAIALITNQVEQLLGATGISAMKKPAK
ncbi:transcriptional regulator BetI [Phyllobacterium sp. YR531]|uniref:transcriptional regulator BetI n=1 Tax=Phyllobacterium sp. YR531 TaxID=1144343 RepID=UPI00026FC412|nr:transcriptional regulator BetI [Phyllobacterium sp. YR531]EJM99439.1 transcriptional regulator [Phyllobacterium sp. YR531]